MTNMLKAMTFISLSTCGASVEKELGRAHGDPIFLLMLTVVDGDASRRLKLLPPCLRGDFVRTYMDENDIDTLESKLKLICHIIIIDMNTNDLELNNATIRRFVKKRVQATSEDALGLSAQWVHSQLRSDAIETQPDPKPAERAPSDEEAEEFKTTGGGGAWRAFVREMGTNDLSEVGNLYRVIKNTVGSEEFAECLEVGLAATRRRSDGMKANSFGPSRKDLNRHRAKHASLAIERVVVAHEGNAFDSVMETAVANGYTLKETSDAIKNVIRARNRSKRKREEEENVAIKAYEVANATRIQNHIAAVAPEASRFVAHYRARPPPASCVTIAEQATSAVVDPCSSLLQYCKDLGANHCNSLSALDQSWALKHVAHECGHEDNKDSSTDEEQVDDRCYKARICLCGHQGNQIGELRNSVLRALKLTFHVKEPWKREKLTDKKFLLHMRPRPMEDYDDGALASFWGLGSDEHYWHVPFQNLAPYCPEIGEMELASDERERETACPDEYEIVLKAHVTVPAQVFK